MEILIIAAHPDDEVLGCGATIAKHTQNGDLVQVIFLADGFSSRANGKIRNNAATKASKILGCIPPLFLNFPDNELDTVPLLNIVKKIEKVINSFNPTIVYTHHFGDLNIDHCIAHKAVSIACRPQPGLSITRIMSFEILSSSEWQLAGAKNVFQPNWFEDVNDTYSLKQEAISAYDFEMREWPHSRSSENLINLAKLRGASVGINLAEAFVVLRVIS